MQVVPLLGISGAELAAVLDEEVECWRRKLNWDFRANARMILECASSRLLAGQVLKTDSGSVVGYCYHLSEGSVGYVGDVFIRRGHATVANYDRLLSPTLRALLQRVGVRRIECQFVPFNCDVTEVFSREGFRTVHRRFLTRRLHERDTGQAPIAGETILPWSSPLLRSAAEVMCDSYRDSPDFELSSDYQSLRGCIRFLRNLLRTSGCGRFCGRTSLIGVDNRGAVVAALLASRIGPGTGMVPQLSVRRSHQGRGWGTTLLRNHFSRSRESGLNQTVLCVSDWNEGALRLYRRLGFQELIQFQAFTWDHPDRIASPRREANQE